MSDLKLLEKIHVDATKLYDAYDGLSLQTKNFLEEEFSGGTGIRLRDFVQNLKEAIEELS